eukprot:2296736-Amphidinium_carterae.1
MHNYTPKLCAVQNHVNRFTETARARIVEACLRDHVSNSYMHVPATLSDQAAETTKNKALCGFCREAGGECLTFDKLVMRAPLGQGTVLLRGPTKAEA